MNNYIDTECLKTLRVIGAEMITKAKSGHPGIVLGAAPIVHTLFTRHLNIDSNDEKWFNRDRFILSAGHGSALLYLILHFSGFDIPMKELANFRQKDSLTPGHPEYGHTAGVEMTTGPLGQGISTSVGLAIAEAHLAAKFNKQACDIIDHYTYVLCGDGDLQEGVTMESMALAGHLRLNKLIVLYDSNDIQLDGAVSLATSDSIEHKVKSMNWNYLRVEDGNDVEEIDEAIRQAKLSVDQPTLIEIKTEIGYGAPTSGESSVHGKPLTEDELQILKDNLDSHQMAFTASKEVIDYYHSSITLRGSQANSSWNYLMSEYAKKYKEDYELLNQYMFNDLRLEDYEGLPEFAVGSSVSTRVVMGKVLDWLSIKIPSLMGGSADLTPSTMVKGAGGIFSRINPMGRNIKFGVREHAMAAITNGITLHGSLRGFCAGFFVFSDYMKPAIRLAAIMGIPSLFFFSHDSVCVGEDGPTHQPVEQLAMFRSMPNTTVFRPADAKEMASAMLLAMEIKDRPTIIVSSRQNLEVLDCTDFEGVSKGAYIAFEPKGTPGSLFVTCGSELALCIQVAKRLEKEDIFVRVVSMPSMDIFEAQSEEYKNKVLPKRITKRMAVEMGSSMCWYKYASKVHGIDEFGKSMPLKYIAEAYGFTEDIIYNEFLDIVKN
ncbi:MAG: transketolase [Anaeroplasmataceae bacterium]|nr:transketolase [Anaeroplasmataceae bacterium]